ncbi:phosphoglyceromutase [Escherichia coli]|uniref:Phosphoglyceromutase n=1 Tax=Escherichia coli TaxID=562 RepID=A0A376UD84_ECOLX|nr:phosphoglyceromutase [Escherichia coli]
MAVTKLVLVRHGESQWNKEKPFHRLVRRGSV